MLKILVKTIQIIHKLLAQVLFLSVLLLHYIILHFNGRVKYLMSFLLVLIFYTEY